MNYYEASMMVWKRKQILIKGFDVNQETTEIIKLFFGDLSKLHTEGLKKQYNLLKNYIIENKMIGLILIGQDIEESVNTYIKKNNKQEKIELTVSSICRYLLNQYFNIEEVKKQCYRTHNIEIYLNI